MSKRFANHRLVKIHRNYSVEQVAETLSVHKNTVRSWIKEGLPVCDERRPVLILGRDLSDFLQVRRTKNKRPCKLGELYCFRCRLPKLPAGAMADCFPVSDKIGHLQAICPDCDCMMNRRVSLAKIGLFAALLSITFPKAQEEVSNTTQPNVNSDFEGGA
jgi:helix-turn-helix protein